jgi:diguanylate cyclase (GGDEF)-like protein
VFGRIGGEEFAILLPDTPADAARMIIERLLDQIRSETVLSESGEEIRFTASAGVASTSADKTTLECLLSAADEALYKAKANGRDRGDG